jgi:K+-sensing histidine kinase KdpD
MIATRIPALNGSAASFEPRHDGNISLLLTDLQAGRAREAHGLQDPQALQEPQGQIPTLSKASDSLRRSMEPIRQAAALIDYAHSDRPLLTRLQGIIENQLAQLSKLADEMQGGADAHARDAGNECGTVDLANLLSLVAARSRPTLTARHQVLSRHALPGTLRVHGDAVRLRQAFSALLEHASRRTPPGGEITLSAQVHADTVSVMLSDGGSGLAPHASSDSFDAQPRGSVTMSNGEQPGFGPVLARAHDLIRAYGGTIDLSCSGSDGSRAFVVTLPKA